MKPFKGTVQSDEKAKIAVESRPKYKENQKESLKENKTENRKENQKESRKENQEESENESKTKSQPLNHNQSQSSLYDRLYKKDATNGSSSPQRPESKSNGIVIDSTTLDNVSESSSEEDSSDESDDGTVYDGNAQTFTNNSASSLFSKQDTKDTKDTKEEPFLKKPKFKRLDVQTRLFDAMLNELRSQDRKTYKFRAIPKKWTNLSQMSDVFLTKHNIPDGFNPKSIYIMNCESVNDNGEIVCKECYVTIKVVPESDEIPQNVYPSIQINDILMAQMKLPKYSRVTLSTKKTVLNFVEKIELFTAHTTEDCNKLDVMEDFKRILIKCSRLSPLLINQDQIFKLCGGNAFVVAKVYPESFRYCLCDGEILRENKLFLSDNQRDISSVLTAAEEIHSSPRNAKQNEPVKSLVNLNENEDIIDDCLEYLVTKNCLDEVNRLRKPNNYLIIGSQTTGKSTICQKIIESLEKPPYNCHVEEFNCAQNKARKVRSYLAYCLHSVLCLELMFIAITERIDLNQILMF